MSANHLLWIALALPIAVTCGVLLLAGAEIHRNARPTTKRGVVADAIGAEPCSCERMDLAHGVHRAVSCSHRS